MNKERPDVLAAGRYSIAETCRLLGINRNSLYKYTHLTGEIRCGYRPVGGRVRKYYTGKEILRFWEASM